MEQAGVVCLLLLLLLSLGCLPRGVFGDGNDVNNKRINNEDDFKSFINDVNSGTTYSGKTVYLDSDLSLSDKKLQPIGKDDSTYYQFRGVFDGQGYTISDLKMNISYLKYTGLFGRSYGLTIRNVVLDSSCSITNSYSGSSKIYVGGVIGYCETNGGDCNIENSVNMADVSFGGDISTNYNSLYLGGIAGYLYSQSYPIYVKNCANYGFVTHSGISHYSDIGGIVGYFSGSTYKYLYNCLNYGTITHSGTTSGYLYLGSITGHSNYAYIENCVSTGGISTQNTPSKSYIGSIVGQVSPYTSINYCYYTSDLSEYDFYGYALSAPSISYTLSYDNTTFELNGTVSVGSYTGTSLINALNAAADYYFLRDYSKWLLNREKKSVTFTINSRTSPITMDSQIILLPSLASEGSLWFDGWYNDNECIYSLESFGIIEDKTLYGKFEENTKSYTISFDTRREGVSVAPITAQFGTAVQLPSKSIREHCNVIFWETDKGYNVGLNLTMPARNFTLCAVWKCTYITSPGDFVDLSKIVNSGTNNYTGTTVLLDSDLSLSRETLEPIGDYSNQFRGVFDGQGHTISGLKMKSFTLYTGLFGYSIGLTIRNVVLDSSCSITSLYSGSDYVCVGGIIGECAGRFNIENSVNMADVSFSGNISGGKYFLCLGGIAGYLSPGYLKNCANYGSVTYSGTSYGSHIGGIVGDFRSQYAYNCLNYGTTTYSGTTTYLRLGGIVGYGNSAYTKNCVSAGKISTQNTATTNYIGNIAGDVGSSMYINHCYYTSDVGGYPMNGAGTPKSTTGTPKSATTVDSSLATELSNYASNNGWNEWLLNMNNAPVTFKVNNYRGFTVNSTLILLPTLTVNNNDGFNSFIWFSDSSFATMFTSPRVTEGTTLYGVYGVIVTVTFDVNGGNELAVTSKKVAFNSTYGTLPEANRTGYMFVGWFTENNSLVTNETIVTITTNHTLHAHWEEVTNQVEIVFNAKDLSKEDVEVIVKKYAGEGTEPTIVGFVEDGSGEISVIITFKDADEAKSFVELIKESSYADSNNLIKKIRFITFTAGTLSVGSSLLLSSLYQFILVLLLIVALL